MICKECGTKLYRSDADEDGRLVCPSCGKRYRLKSKPADGVADTESASAKSGTATRKTAAKAKNSKRSKKRKNGSGKIILIVSVLALIAAAVVIAFVVKGGSDSGKDSSFLTVGTTTTDENKRILSESGSKSSASSEKGRAANPNIGKSCVFGNYEQDHVTTNGKEPIEWIILEEESDGTLVLISKYILDYQQYGYMSSSWPDCSLRDWLNDTFYFGAFSEDERNLILITEIKDEHTEDRVYLLSVSEAGAYFRDEASRYCEPTNFVTIEYDDDSYWWLRTIVKTKDYNKEAAFVDGGTVSTEGRRVTGSMGVRPVIRVPSASVTIGETSPYVRLHSRIGENYEFGSYPQGWDEADEPIEWVIIGEESDGTLVLMSEYALDCKPYNTQKTDVTWETCSLRAWLNNEFYNEAFTSEEKERILSTNVKVVDYSGKQAMGDNYTEDKVYLLSRNEISDYPTSEEMYSYFGTSASRKCKGTAYASSHGVYRYQMNYSSDNGNCYWWLRTQPNSREAVYVSIIGSFNSAEVTEEDIGVRPVIRIHPANV